LQLLELLLRRYPAAAAHADEARGWLPLHVVAAAAARQGAMKARMVRLVREAHPAALNTPDHQGRLPLHVLVGDHNNDYDAENSGVAAASFSNRPRPRRCAPSLSAALNVLLQGANGAAALRHADHRGRLPLHVACSSNNNVFVIQQMVRAHPRSVQAWAAPVGLPLFAAASRRCEEDDNSSLDVVLYLVRQSPELFLRATGAEAAHANSSSSSSVAASNTVAVAAAAAVDQEL